MNRREREATFCLAELGSCVEGVEYRGQVHIASGLIFCHHFVVLFLNSFSAQFFTSFLNVCVE